MEKPQHPASIRQALRDSIWVSAQTNELSEGRIDFGPEHDQAFRRRVTVSASLCCIAFEHQTAITCLVDLHRRASAFALMRPVFDAFWRALWIAYVATDDQVHAFAEGRFDPKFDTASRSLDQVEGFPPLFQAVKAQGWKAMSEFTHGAGRQVQRFFSADTIQPVHSDDETVQLLHQAGWFALVAATLLTNVARRDVGPCDAALATYVQITAGTGSAA